MRCVRTAWRDGRLHATRHGDEVALNGYLDDYAFLLAALIEVMQTRFRRDDWKLACALADRSSTASRIASAAASGSRATTTSGCSTGRSPAHDNATPSGNGVAAQALITLGHLASEPRYVDAAERAVRLFAPVLAEPAGIAVRRC